MSKQLIAVLIGVIILVAGATMWLLSRSNSPTVIPATTDSSSGSTGFPDSTDTPRPKNDTSVNAPKGDDTKTGNGFLSSSKTTGKFQELVHEPVAGAIALLRKNNKNDSILFVRYIERATGHIKELVFGQQEASRVSNTTIPKVAQASFAPEGSAAVVRALTDPFNQVATILAQVKTASSTIDSSGTLFGVTIPEQVSDYALSPSGKDVFTLISDINGGSHGVLQTIAGKNRREVFNSPLSEWLTTWSNEDAINLTTKPSMGLPGYLYAFSTKNSSLHRLLGPLPALGALVSPSGTRIFVSTVSSTGLRTFIYDKTTGTQPATPLLTLAEKCVWSHKSDALYCAVPDSGASFGQLPDSWYRGDNSFNDSFWKIDAKNMATTYLSAPEGETVDGINLSLDPSETTLLFNNKKNSSLWSLKLTE